MCGLALAVLGVPQPVPAYAETVIAVAPSPSASDVPSAPAEPAATPQPTASATATSPAPTASATATQSPPDTASEESPIPAATATPSEEPTAEPTAVTDLDAAPSGPAATYIVGFRADVDPDDALGERDARSVEGLDAVVTELTAAEAKAVAGDPSVAYVQKDRVGGKGTRWGQEIDRTVGRAVTRQPVGVKDYLVEGNEGNGFTARRRRLRGRGEPTATPGSGRHRGRQHSRRGQAGDAGSGAGARLFGQRRLGLDGAGVELDPRGSSSRRARRGEPEPYRGLQQGGERRGQAAHRRRRHRGRGCGQRRRGRLRRLAGLSEERVDRGRLGQ